jgi:hypothetical protein
MRIAVGRTGCRGNSYPAACDALSDATAIELRKVGTKLVAIDTQKLDN